MSGRGRIVFLDWLRALACFMVMLVHACEAFYFDDAGNTCFRSLSDARWAVGIDSLCRAAVPLFVMASAYLLFPVAKPAGEFFRRRLARVGVPFVLWSGVYIVWNAWTPGAGIDWAGLGASCARFAFNFPLTAGGHLWFVPMLLGLYLLMPLLSPWAERATEKELRGWLCVWLFTTLFPFARKLWGVCFAGACDAAAGTAWAHTFGTGAWDALPWLWGECPWNTFGTFHYVSGFFGYVLLGFYLRKFKPEIPARALLTRALPAGALGYALTAGFFYFRIPFDGTFPLVRPYALAVDLETSWEFCSLGVAAVTFAWFAFIRAAARGGRFYERAVRPVSEASYAMYLMHMLVLAPVVGWLRRCGLPTPAVIALTAVVTYLVTFAAARALRRVPRLNAWAGLAA